MLKNIFNTAEKTRTVLGISVSMRCIASVAACGTMWFRNYKNILVPVNPVTGPRKRQEQNRQLGSKQLPPHLLPEHLILISALTDEMRKLEDLEKLLHDFFF